MWNVMAADDEAYIRQALPALIDWNALGCRLVKVLPDGQALLDEMAVLHPDLVVTDIRMPGADGLDVCRYVHDTCPETQVILLTAYSDFQYAKMALRYSACEYVLKIDVAEELPAAVRKAVLCLEKQRREILEERAMPQEGAQGNLYAGICRYIEQNFTRNFSLTELAESLHASPSYLSRLYKARSGENLFDNVLNRRIERAKYYLRATDMKIYEIGLALGFEDTGYFSRVFKKATGSAPKEYRNGTS